MDDPFEDVGAIIEANGSADLAACIEDVIGNNTTSVEQFKAGQIMRSSKGRVNPQDARSALIIGARYVTLCTYMPYYTLACIIRPCY